MSACSVVAVVGRVTGAELSSPLVFAHSNDRLVVELVP